MRVLGIDPGFTGGLVVVKDGGVESLDVMPIIEVNKKKSRKVRKTDPEWGKQKTKTIMGKHKMIDLHKLNMMIGDLKDVDVCYLEQVGARPMEGVVGAFRFGQGFGNLEAFLVAHGIEYRYITPSVWTKVIHEGMAKSIDAKDRSRMAVKKFYPSIDLIRKGCRKEHEGLVDALLIAKYGYDKENPND